MRKLLKAWVLFLLALAVIAVIYRLDLPVFFRIPCWIYAAFSIVYLAISGARYFEFQNKKPLN